jgi:hypothetical protein
MNGIVGGFLFFGSAFGSGGDMAVNLKSKPADTSRTNNTIADDPDLAFTSVAAGRYGFIMSGRITCGSVTPGFKIGFKSSVTPNMSGTIMTFYTAGSGNLQRDSDEWVTSPGGIAYTTSAGTNIVCFTVQGFIDIPSSANLTVMWAQSTTNATAVVLKQGTYCALLS